VPPAASAFHPQDLEYLISKAVNPKSADYAVVTGVQIHNWASDLDDARIPSMEFVAPARAYVVINGEKIDLDLQQVCRVRVLSADG
jgi:Ni,Fe-hydrogenase III small subunit